MSEAESDDFDYVTEVLNKILKGKVAVRHLAEKALDQYGHVKAAVKDHSRLLVGDNKDAKLAGNERIQEEPDSSVSTSEYRRNQEELIRENKALAQTVENYKVTVSENDQKLKESRRNIQQLINRRLITPNTKSKDREEVDNLKIQYEKVREELSNCKATLSRRDEKLKVHEQTIYKLSKDKADLLERIETMTKENEAFKAELAQLEQLHRKQSNTDSTNQDKLAQTETSVKKSSHALEKQREENKALSEKIRKLERQLDELNKRFQVLASNKLTSGNPDIADLSDVYRPTNIADQFRQMYDTEWTHAYEDLEKLYPNDDVQAVLNLANMLKALEVFCSDASEQQMQRLQQVIQDELTYPKFQHKSGTVVAGQHRAEYTNTQTEVAKRFLKDTRKALGIVSTGPLIQVFHKVYMTDNNWKEQMFTPGINSFIIEGVRLVWMMKMQDPPMQFVWAQPGDIIDKSRFTFYMKSGDTVKYSVWPAMVLHKDGPLMSKGIVQA